MNILLALIPISLLLLLVANLPLTRNLPKKNLPKNCTPKTKNSTNGQRTNVSLSSDQIGNLLRSHIPRIAVPLQM